MTEQSEFKVLLERAQQGDHAAESQLYTEFRPHIERVIHRRLQDLKLLWAVDPPDVYDSVWMSIRQGQSLESIKTALSFARYLEAAVRKKTLQIRRRLFARKRDVRKTLSFECEQLASDDGEPSAELELAELIEMATDQLSPRELVVCTMYIEGRSWHKIGESLGISTDAARMVRQRAEHRVREWIAGGGAPQVDRIECKRIPCTIVLSFNGEEK
ncbi:MAG: hypothetical protein H8E66_27840 [Planctomycetes bacterium]|nr:hypothetical protein [Planctomycetota bacterium]